MTGQTGSDSLLFIAGTMLNKLKKKYKNISQHIAYKGLPVFIKSKAYDYYQKYRLKQLGIYHAPVTGDKSLTSSKAVNKDAEENMPSSFYEMAEGLGQTGLKNKDVSLIDIGCGEGRILNFGMLLNFKEVFGIELDETAYKKAIENCEKMKSKGYTTAFHIEHMDAALYDLPQNINVVYLFNPFREKTMESIVEKVVAQVNKFKTPIYVIYCVPVWVKVFEQFPACKKIYENFNKAGTDRYIAVYKITPQV